MTATKITLVIREVNSNQCLYNRTTAKFTAENISQRERIYSLIPTTAQDFTSTEHTPVTHCTFTHQKQHRQKFVTMRRKIYSWNLTNCTTNYIKFFTTNDSMCGVYVGKKKEKKVNLSKHKF